MTTLNEMEIFQLYLQHFIFFTFGKYKGKEVEEVLKQDPGYFGWVLKSDFPRFTKKILTEIRLRNLNTK